MNYWQIGSGSHGRDYADAFLRFGMAFVGGKHQVATMDKVSLGDRIILKSGVSEVVAVGQVVERDGVHVGKNDKPWLRDFDGWDLRAYCYVAWVVPEEPIVVKAGLTRGTIARVRIRSMRELADKVLSSGTPVSEVVPEPARTAEVGDGEIVESLIRHGLRPGAAEDLTVAFRRVRHLARYYYDGPERGDFKWEDIREHETRTYLIVPLLLALGWAEQQMKIEMPTSGQMRADIACFRAPYRAKTMSPVLILESKGFNQGLDFASEQAAAYAERYPDCELLVTSNGYCYKTYPRGETGFCTELPSAYLNLLRPRDRYPIDPERVDGCLEVLRLLLPASFV